MHEKRHNEYLQKNRDNYKHKADEQEYQEDKSPVRLQIISQNSILIFKGFTGNVNVVPYFFLGGLRSSFRCYLVKGQI